MTRPVSGQIQPPVQQVLGDFCPRIKRPGKEADSTIYSAEDGQVKVKGTLRLEVGQTVCLGVEPLPCFFLYESSSSIRYNGNLVT